MQKESIDVAASELHVYFTTAVAFRELQRAASSDQTMFRDLYDETMRLIIYTDNAAIRVAASKLNQEILDLWPEQTRKAL